MNSRTGLVYGLHAVGTFNGASSGAAWLRARGFSSGTFTRNGAGDYTMTLDAAIDTTGAQHGFLAGTSDGAQGAGLDVAIVSATTVRCRSGVSGTGTDMTFTVGIYDLGLN